MLAGEVRSVVGWEAGEVGELLAGMPERLGSCWLVGRRGLEVDGWQAGDVGSVVVWQAVEFG